MSQNDPLSGIRLQLDILPNLINKADNSTVATLRMVYGRFSVDQMTAAFEEAVGVILANNQHTIYIVGDFEGAKGSPGNIFPHLKQIITNSIQLIKSGRMVKVVFVVTADNILYRNMTMLAKGMSFGAIDFRIVDAYETAVDEIYTIHS